MANVQIFLSAVSKEFRSYRDALRRDLDRPNVTVKVQEDFIATGTETLDKLDEYIQRCDAVLHLVGDMSGALAEAPSVAAIRQRYPDLALRLPVLAPFVDPGAPPLSYTQWEAWLALYHGKTLLIAAPHPSAARDEGFQLVPEQLQAQQAHLQRLQQMERYPEIHFTSADRLAVEVLRSRLQAIVARAGGVHKPVNLPYRSLGERFVGRGALLDRLHHALAGPPGAAAGSARPVVLTGLSGAGKTRVALEYAWAHAGDHTALLFATGDSPEALRGNLAALCRKAVLDLPEQVDQEESRQFDAVLRWLRLHRGWLLILDNLDSEDDALAAEALLPALEGGQVLLTSQLLRWSGSVQTLAVDALPADAAAELLLARTAGQRRVRADDAEQARALAEELGGLPLALEQAGAYVATHRRGLGDYLASWRQQRHEVLGWFDARLMSCEKSLAMTCQTSLQALDPAARALMHQLAWLEAAPIPEALLDLPPDDVPGLPPGSDAFTALVELAGQSLVQQAIDAPVFTVNRLMLEMTRRMLGPDERRTTLAGTLRWVRAAWQGDPEDVRSWPVLEPLLPHALGLARRADAEGQPGVAAWLMRQCGLLLLAKGRLAEALPLAQRALALREALHDGPHAEVAESLELLGNLHIELWAEEPARACLQRALDLRTALHGPDHPDLSETLMLLAGHHFRHRHYVQAEALVQRALHIREQALGPVHADVAASLSLLAATCNMQGDFERARPLLDRTLAMQERTLGPEHPRLGITLNNLAYLLVIGAGDDAQAAGLLERAVAIQEKTLGAHHPGLALQLTNLSNVYERTAPAKARAPAERALAIQEAALGADHPEVARTLCRLAWVHEGQGDAAEGLACLERALAIRERALAPGHVDLAGVLEELGVQYFKLGRMEEALAQFERALPIREAAGPGYPMLCGLLRYLSAARVRLGASEESQQALLDRADALESRHKAAEAAASPGSSG
jgi:tetratricopeptide (TPR) repeat protein